MNDLLTYALGLNRYYKHHSNNNETRKYPQLATTFPPFNIIVDDEKNPSFYQLDIAVAGFSKDDIQVKTTQKNGTQVLEIYGRPGKKTDSTIPADVKNYVYLTRGMAERSFYREFTMTDDLEISDVSLKDGILKIRMNVNISSNKEKVFDIS